MLLKALRSLLVSFDKVTFKWLNIYRLLMWNEQEWFLVLFVKTDFIKRLLSCIALLVLIVLILEEKFHFRFSHWTARKLPWLQAWIGSSTFKGIDLIQNIFPRLLYGQLVLPTLRFIAKMNQIILWIYIKKSYNVIFLMTLLDVNDWYHCALLVFFQDLTKVYVH